MTQPNQVARLCENCFEQIWFRNGLQRQAFERIIAETIAKLNLTP